MKLKPLDSQVIEKSIKNAINSGNWSTILTLVDGDLLFGDLRYFPRFFPGTSEEAENAGLWIPDRWTSLPRESRFAYQLRPVCLVFNSKAGTKHGRACHVNIKDELISGIRPLFWTEESLSSLTLKNVPNPMASLIYEHNFKVASKYGLHIGTMIEAALPEAGLPPSGIDFTEDEIIYTDWEFFSHVVGGSLSAGAYGISVGFERSLYGLARDKITNGIIEKITGFLSGRKPIGECRLQGFLVVPQPEITTSIEGDECIVVICSDQKSFSPKIKFIPAILKKRAISYPIEFLPFINSSLVFYGEMRQIPLEIGGLKSDYTLMTRAIGYVAVT